MYKINDEVTPILKKPLGVLYPKFEDAIEDIKKSNFFISVGDATLNNLINVDLYPNLSIIDQLIQRKNHDFNIINSENLFNAKNLAVVASMFVIGVGGTFAFPNGNIPIGGIQLPAIATASIFGIVLNLLLSIGEKKQED